METMVISVLLDKRIENAPELQEIFTRHGSIIKVRLGIHDIIKEGNQGLIILTVDNSNNSAEGLIKDLKAYPDAKIGTITV